MLRSMRARITFAFVFVLAPFLIGASHLVILAHHHSRGQSFPIGGKVLSIQLQPSGVGDGQGLEPLLLLSATAVVAFAIASWLIVGSTLSPIRSLARQAAEARADQPGTRLKAPSKDAEIEALVTTLNGFLGRMEEASEEKGRFYAAASHELRTPLQALSGHLEVALGQPRSVKEYRSALKEAHTQTQRLTSLAEGILLLHQLQGGVLGEREPVCLSTVVQEVVDSLQPLAEARSLTLDSQIAPSVSIPSIPAHATALVRNLIENAAKYSREQTVISIDLDQSRLRISNAPPEGAQIDVDRLFEPFYRLDASRSTKSGGNGLGLAICMAVCKANGWKLSLSQEQARVVAQVTFSGTS
jgi:two-component system OmpR family sensor kinase